MSDWFPRNFIGNMAADFVQLEELLLKGDYVRLMQRLVQQRMYLYDLAERLSDDGVSLRVT